MVTLAQLDVQIGHRIRLLRMERGITQDKLARALEISFQQVQKYERGVNRVTVGRLYQMAQLFRIPVGYFFRGVGFDALIEGSVRQKSDSDAASSEESRFSLLDYVGLSERQEPLCYLSYQEGEEDFTSEEGREDEGHDGDLSSLHEGHHFDEAPFTEEEIRAEEAKYLLEAFYRIKDDVIRHQIFELVCTLASKSEKKRKMSEKAESPHPTKTEKM